MTIGENIKKIRLQKKITQEELAQYLNYSKQSISNWENNRNCPPLEAILNISHYFDVSLEKIIEKEDESMKSSKASDSNLKKELIIYSIISLLGAIIFFVSISYVKYYGASFLIIALIGIIIMLSGGWKINYLKKNKDNLNNYQQILEFLKKNKK